MICITQQSSKIQLDKHYTSPELARYVVEKTKEVVGEKNITEYLEPSAGSGVFLDYLDKPYLAYDIEPEDSRILKQDYLTLDLSYKAGRCTIGNPPYGMANSKLKQFYKKSVLIGEYISFIIPISQLNNNNELYDYDLIHSEDLGVREYSNIKKHCCLNIYKKPKHPNFKPKHKYKDVEIIGWRKAKQTDCDFYICCYGSGVGRFVEKDSELVNVNGVIVHNKELKSRVRQVFEDARWVEMYPMMSSPNLLQWQMYKHLKEEIPELE